MHGETHPRRRVHDGSVKPLVQLVLFGVEESCDAPQAMSTLREQKSARATSPDDASRLCEIDAAFGTGALQGLVYVSTEDDQATGDVAQHGVLWREVRADGLALEFWRSFHFVL